jgi:hypothetical protein
VKHVKIVNTSCTNVLWFKLSKSVVNTDEDIICGIVYLPPEGSRYASPDCYVDMDNELYISLSMDCKYVYLMGNFNSRVGQLPDWFSPDDFQLHLHKCEDTFNASIETRTMIFNNNQIPLYRRVKYVHVNDYGYKLIDLCKNNDIYIVNGRVGGDKYVGGLTCKSSSTVD